MSIGLLHAYATKHRHVFALAQANHSVVMLKAAHPFYGALLGTSRANHSTVKSRNKRAKPDPEHVKVRDSGAVRTKAV